MTPLGGSWRGESGGTGRPDRQTAARTTRSSYPASTLGTSRNAARGGQPDFRSVAVGDGTDRTAQPKSTTSATGLDPLNSRRNFVTVAVKGHKRPMPLTSLTGPLGIFRARHG